MREPKTFGKRSTHKDKEKVDLGKVFGVVNNGCDSQQIKNFIKKTTGKELK